jgi:hypothetical protein
MVDDLCLERLDRFAHVGALVGQFPDCLRCRPRQVFVGAHELQQLFHLADALRNDHPEFGCQATHGVDQHRALFDQQRTNRVQ